MSNHADAGSSVSSGPREVTMNSYIAYRQPNIKGVGNRHFFRRMD